MNLTFSIADANPEPGDLLLVLVARDQALTAPDGWTQLEAALGGGSIFLDVFARQHEANDPDTATFTSGPAQELQGTLVLVRGAALQTVKEASASAAFAADATPGTPASSSVQAINIALCVWSADTAVALTPPAGFTLLDSYTSNVVAPRSFLAAYKLIGATGAFAPPDAASAPASSGRAFTLILRNAPPVVPGVLEDPVPGNIGFYGRDVRVGR